MSMITVARSLRRLTEALMTPGVLVSAFSMALEHPAQVMPVMSRSMDCVF